ncbi:uncharacterized protein LOC141638666 [Silene latifolia]|uniref:uncharacterized protein LOC141638666 n=1 Tax=Silene latifolia TaxID=37657 RepID=UPI003D77AC72
MVDWLLERYDTHTRLLLFNRFVHFSISKHDVYDVFMLPCEGEDVPTVTDDKDLVQCWRKRFGALPNKDIKLDQVVRVEMLKLVDGGPDFKRLFVLFAMGSFLAPTVHNRIDTRLIGAVEDVDAIPKMDWCSYIMDRFDNSVDSWKENEGKSMGGCLMFFQIVYFHRLIWRGLPEKRTLPLIRHWTYDAMKKRVKEECKAYTVHRGFGIGVWDLTTYPISLFLEKTFYKVAVDRVEAEVTAIRQEAARQAEKDDAGVEAIRKEAGRAAEKDTIAQDTGSRTVTFTLPDDLPSDEDLRFLYNDPRVLKWYQTKRNQKLISRLHRDVAAEMMSDPPLSQQVQQQHEGIGEAAGEAEQTFSQRLDSDPAFYAEFIAMLDQVDAAMENVVLPPSFDLGLDDIGEKTPARSYALRYTRARDRAPGGPVNNAAPEVSRAPNRPVPKPAGKKKAVPAVSR